MPDSNLSDVYTALQNADAAGDTASAQQLADYIRSVPAGASTSRVGNNRLSWDPRSPDFQYSPTGSFGQNLAAGAGSLYPGLALGAKQLGAMATGGDPSAQTEPLTGDTAAERAKLNAPLDATAGGFLGKAGAAAPLAFIPGANTALGGAAIGTGLGALTPANSNEERLLNTGLGALGGVAGQGVGSKAGQWATGRAAEPFMGWNPNTASAAVAQAVGSDAPKLTQPALADTNARLGSIFSAARSPNVNVPLSLQTAQAVHSAALGLNKSSLDAYGGNSAVTDLMALLRNGNASAAQLGKVSSDLGSAANAEMTTKMGDRALGRSLFKLQDHVDNLVGSSIQDSQLASAYAAARPQWRTLQMLESRPTLLNSATGDANLTAIGKYLQRADKPGYTRGGNQSPMYQAARWGQATGEGKGAPNFTLTNFGLPWLAYQGLNNPISRAAGGAASRALQPAAPYLGRIGQGLVVPAIPKMSRGLLSLEASGP